MALTILDRLSITRLIAAALKSIRGKRMAIQETDVTVLSSAARTATTTSAEFQWLDAKAFMVVNVTAVTSSPGITPELQVYDAASGIWVAIYIQSSPSTPTTAHTYLYIFTDTAFTPSGSTIQESKQVYLAPRMRVVITHADADSCTYSVGFNRVNSNVPVN